MASKITSHIKGHYNYKYKVGEELECLREPENEFSKHAISVNTEETQRNEQKIFFLHMPDVLSEMVFKLLSEWKVSTITTKITWIHRRASEGTWVPGVGIEMSCTYFLYGAKIHKNV